MQRYTHILLLATIFSARVSQAQLLIDNSQTASALVQNTLLGGGVTVSNITFNGMSGTAVYDQLAGFNSANANVGINDGIMLTTGSANVAYGPNNSDGAFMPVANSATDVDLQTLAGGIINDAAVLEFDFVPSGPQVSFNFVFASEEYLEFVNLYNDVFGFFLSGPGISGPYANGAENIALIPGTATPVSINTLNAGSYSNFYVDNGDGWTAPYNSDPSYIQFDGMTTSITASATVQCGQQYHIKLAVGDATDEFYDSGVFLQSNAFSSPTMSVTTTPDLNLPCSGASVDLSILNITGGIQPYTSTWSYNGSVISSAQTITVAPGATGTYTAIVTDDCGGSVQQTVNIGAPVSPPMTLTLSPDVSLSCQGSATLEVLNVVGGTTPFTYTWTLNGNVVSNALSISVTSAQAGTYTVTVDDDCNGSQQGSIVVNVPPPTSLTVSATPDLYLPCQGSVDLNTINVSGGIAPYTYTWTLNGVVVGSTQSIQVANGSQGNYQVNVSDACGGSGTATVIVSPPNVAPIVVATSIDVTVSCIGDLATLAVTSTTGGDGQYNYAWVDATGTTVSTDPTMNIAVASDATYTLNVTDNCSGSATTTVSVFAPAPLQIDLPTTAVACKDGSTVLSAEPIGGSGFYTYLWMPSNETTESITVFPLGDSTFTVIVTDACGTVVSDHIEVRVEIPVVNIHAENVSADEFDFTAQCDPSNATFDWSFSSGGNASGSNVNNTFADDDIYWATVTATTINGCLDVDSVFLTPAAQLFFPNAFTPNGDGINDTFGPVGYKLDKLEFTVFDRWGAAVFTANSPDQTWDGRFQNGDIAPTGVYVFKYSAFGERLNDYEGFGSVTLLGDDTAQR